MSFIIPNCFVTKQSNWERKSMSKMTGFVWKYHDLQSPLQMKSIIDNNQSYLMYNLIFWKYYNTTYNDYIANILILQIPIFSTKCKIDKNFVHHNISLLFTTLYRHKCGMSLSAKVYQFKSFRPIPRNLSQRQMSEYFFVVATFETFVFSSL